MVTLSFAFQNTKKMLILRKCSANEEEVYGSKSEFAGLGLLEKSKVGKKAERGVRIV